MIKHDHNQTLPQQIYSYNNFTDTINGLKEWFFYILRKWWLIGIIAVVAGIAGIIKAWLQKPKYESHLTFALEDGESGLSGALSLAADFGFNLGGGNTLFEGDNILNLLMSRRIIERVLLSVDTVNGQPITMANYLSLVSSDSTKRKKNLSEEELRLSKVSFQADQPRSSFSYLQDSVLFNIYKSFVEDNGLLKVSKPDKKLNLYEVSVISPDERFTKVFTERLVSEATEFYTELKSKKSKQTLEILEDRVAKTKGSVNNAIVSRAEIEDANVNPAFQRAQAELQKKQVDLSAYGGAYAELYKNLELARYQYLKDIPLLQIIDGADYPMKKIKDGRLKTGLIFSIIAFFLAVFFYSIRFIMKRAFAAADQEPADA